MRVRTASNFRITQQTGDVAGAVVGGAAAVRITAAPGATLIH